MGNEFIATYKVPQSGARTELLCDEQKESFVENVPRFYMKLYVNCVDECVFTSLRKHMSADNAYGLKVI